MKMHPQLGLDLLNSLPGPSIGSRRSSIRIMSASMVTAIPVAWREKRFL
jgi:hypothetical protein